MGSLLIISLTFASSSPLTLFSLSFFQVNGDLCVASFLSKIFNSFFFDFFCFFHNGVHLFTMPLKFFLPFCSVSGKVPFNVQLCQRLSFCLFFPGSKLYLTNVQLWLSFFPRLCSRSVSYFLGRVVNVLLCSREIFFLIALVFHHLPLKTVIDLLLSASSPSTFSLFERLRRPIIFFRCGCRFRYVFSWAQ